MGLRTSLILTVGLAVMVDSVSSEDVFNRLATFGRDF
jgi:hypothetical protein